MPSRQSTRLRHRFVPRQVALTLACLLLIGMAGCAGLDRRPPPSFDDIARMSDEGLADEQIIAQLRETGAIYPLTASQIIDLNEKGVSAAVLDYMQQTYIQSVRRRERMMYSDPWFGYPCFGCGYPYGRVVPFYVYPY